MQEKQIVEFVLSSSGDPEYGTCELLLNFWTPLREECCHELGTRWRTALSTFGSCAAVMSACNQTAASSAVDPLLPGKPEAFFFVGSDYKPIEP